MVEGLTLREILYEIKVKGNNEYYINLLEDSNIQHVISKVTSKYRYNQKEIRDECKLLILEATRKYDYNDNFSYLFFLEYIYKFLPKGVYRYAQKLNQIPLGDVSNIRDTNSNGIDIDVINLKMALGKLKPKEREIIKEIYFNGKTEEELGAEKGVTQQAINNRRRRAIKKLHKIMQ